MVEGVRGYPNSPVWFVGLMLIVPAARSAGLGRLGVAAIERFARNEEACSEMELAVLTSNLRSLRFWQAQGFIHRRNAPAAQFGQRIHGRWILGKQLRDSYLHPRGLGRPHGPIAGNDPPEPSHPGWWCGVAGRGAPTELPCRQR